MRAIKWFANLFGKQDDRSEEQRVRDAKVGEGVRHFMEGSQYFNAGQDKEALDCFDRALACGFEHHELFEMRAMSLQRQDYDLDAIEDFGKAIAGQPQDCNLYFLRALSLRAVGRYEEAANGFREAIRLSATNNARNVAYHAAAKDMGHPSANSVFESHLAMTQVDLRMSDTARQVLLSRRQFKRRERK